MLLLCAHGTDDPAGQAVVQTLAERVAAQGGLRVVPTWVDVQHPQVGPRLAELVAAGERVVVVPALLSRGYHTGVDIAEAAAAHPGRAVVTPPLGPDDRLAGLLVRRLHQAGATTDDAVLLAAAGSSRADSAEDVQQAAATLSQRWGAPVSPAYGAKAQPRVAEAVAAARAGGARRVVLASYLLAPGFFHDRLLSRGADVVTEPLGAADELVQVVLDRYRAHSARAQAS